MPGALGPIRSGKTKKLLTAKGAKNGREGLEEKRRRFVHFGALWTLKRERSILVPKNLM
jgi:hypothetical protein